MFKEQSEEIKPILKTFLIFYPNIIKIYIHRKRFTKWENNKQWPAEYQRILVVKSS